VAFEVFAAFDHVSTHAPARGATVVPAPGKDSKWCFNPRTRTGCDLKTRYPICAIQGFNPRTRTGCDGTPSPPAHRHSVSTHAPARGATLQAKAQEYLDTQFQPTHPHGVRHYRWNHIAPHVSTHAPARGATWQESATTGTTQVSTHAPARGATWQESATTGTTQVSTHAPARGATVCAGFAGETPHVSTHAPARGATPVTTPERKE